MEKKSLPHRFQNRIGFIAVLLIVLWTTGFILSCASPPPPTPPPAAPVEVPPPPPPPPPAPPPPKSEPDTEGPVIEVRFSPQYFSPDNDGENDVLEVSISVKDESRIADWLIEIREPQPPYLLFSEWHGTGEPPARITWDGRSASGELVQSASDYPFRLTVTDVMENSSVFDGEIEVDVLVIREGDHLKVQVPSIVFGSNSGGFDGLDAETIAANDYILRRIAQVLNKFHAYQVEIEGHANPLARTERERQREEQQELQPLSELRAKAVLDYLVRLGVAGDRLSYVGMGGTKPVAAYEDRDNWWKNRRVEFILVR
jgi:outer membrane protein OmpA-like peptidoglycan-associated protein